MATPNRTSWGNVKPLLGAQIDWGHPLSNGLYISLLVNEGAGEPIDLITRKRALFTSAPMWSVSREGLSLSTDGSDDEIRFPIPAQLLNVGAWTVSLICRKRSAPDLVNLWNFNTGSLNKGICYWWTSGNGMLCQGANLGSSTDYSVELSIDTDITKLHHYHWTSADGDVRPKIYVDGVHRSSNGSAGLSPEQNEGRFDLSRGSAGGFHSDTEYLAAWVWDRELLADECAAHALNPYAFIQSPSHRQYFFQGEISAEPMSGGIFTRTLMRPHASINTIARIN